MGYNSIIRRNIYIAVLLGYIVFVFCITFLGREVYDDKHRIQTEWFWGYKSPGVDMVYKDNLNNILLFIPIGVLSGLVFRNKRLLLALLCGLFISETIECAQLIWKRGTFDVDDLLNNTIGSLAGGLIAVLAIWLLKTVKKRPISL